MNKRQRLKQIKKRNTSNRRLYIDSISEPSLHSHVAPQLNTNTTFITQSLGDLDLSDDTIADLRTRLERQTPTSD